MIQVSPNTFFLDSKERINTGLSPVLQDYDAAFVDNRRVALEKRIDILNPGIVGTEDPAQLLELALRANMLVERFRLCAQLNLMNEIMGCFVDDAIMRCRNGE